MMGQEIQPKEYARPEPYSLGWKAGNTVWVAGQTSVDDSGNPTAIGDPRGQAARIFQRIGRILQEAGATPQDVVFIRTYSTDMRYQPVIREERVKFFQGHRPASTSVQVVALAAPEYLLEIEVVAVIGDGAAR
jgi:enamine deaminase RidA (YjgF/YER057c/UK114 family)